MRIKNTSFLAAVAAAAGSSLFVSCAEAPPPPVQTTAAVAAGPEAMPAAATAVPVSATAATPPRVTPDADFRANKPAPGPDVVFKVPAVKRFKLKNGLPVILAESHELPLVTFDLNIKSGGAANPKGMAGLADLTSNMLDEGTKTRSALQIADEVAFLGANLGVGASWESSSVSIGTLSKNVDQALAIWADVIVNPVFDEKELSRLRENLLTALTRRKDSPPQVASLTYARALYGEDHPYAWPQNGTEETIKKMTVADLKKFYDTHYRPGNAVLAVSGDITEAEVKAKLEPLLKAWKPKAVAEVKLPKAPQHGKTRVYLVDKAGAPQSSIRVGLIGIERRHPDYFPALVMNMVLGGTGFHRLGLNLREGKGWTYGVSCGFDMRKTPGPWTASGEFVAARTADSVNEILGEIKKMRDVDVPEDELRQAKDYIIKAFPTRFATDNAIAAQMVSLALYGLPDAYWDSFTQKLATVTVADVRKMAQKYLQPSNLAIVVVGDQKSNEEALKKIADLELRDLEGKPVVMAAADAAPGAKTAN